MSQRKLYILSIFILFYFILLVMIFVVIRCVIHSTCVLFVMKRVISGITGRLVVFQELLCYLIMVGLYSLLPLWLAGVRYY